MTERRRMEKMPVPEVDADKLDQAKRTGDLSKVREDMEKKAKDIGGLFGREEKDDLRDWSGL